MSSIPNYYEILGINAKASESEIRTAYKKQSLLHHPDRQKDASAKERQASTEKFQLIADAYYVLSDKGRRRAYDSQRSARGGFQSQQSEYASAGASGMPGGAGGFFGGDNTDSASANFFNTFFGKGGAGFSHADEDSESSFGGSDAGRSARPDADHVFGDVFDDLLAPEVERVLPFWKYAGAGAGAVMGFIIGNLPGAAVGAYGGGKVGAIRDAKGKAVASVFKDLDGGQKAAILQSLLGKVMASVVA